MIKLQKSGVDVLQRGARGLGVGQNGLNGVQLRLILLETRRNRLNRKRLDHLGARGRSLRHDRGQSSKTSSLHRTEVHRDTIDSRVKATESYTIRRTFDLRELLTATDVSKLLLDLVDSVADTRKSRLVRRSLDVAETLNCLRPKAELLLYLVDGPRDSRKLRLVRSRLDLAEALSSFRETKLLVDAIDVVRQSLEVDLTSGLRQIAQTVGGSDLPNSRVK